MIKIRKDNILDSILSEGEDASPIELLKTVNSEINEYLTYSVIQQYNKKEIQIAFLSGSHPRLGKNSILNRNAFFKNPIYDKNVVEMLFKYLEDSPTNTNASFRNPF